MKLRKLILVSFIIFLVFCDIVAERQLGSSQLGAKDFKVYRVGSDEVVAKIDEPIESFFDESENLSSPLLANGMKIYFDKWAREIVSIFILSDDYYVGQGIQIGDDFSKVREQFGMDYYSYPAESIDGDLENLDYDNIYLYYWLVLVDMGYYFEFDTLNNRIVRIVVGIAV